MRGRLGSARSGGGGRLKGIGQGGGGRLVEDVEHLQAGDASGVLDGLAAGVVEVGGHGDDRLADGADAGLGVLHQFAENDGRQRFRAEIAAGDGPAVGRVAHVPLDERGDAVGLFEGHVEGGLADDGLALGRQEDGAGREHFTVAVGQRHRLAVVVQRGDGAERGAQVDADQLSRAARHVRLPSGEGMKPKTAVPSPPRAGSPEGNCIVHALPT